MNEKTTKTLSAICVSAIAIASVGSASAATNSGISYAGDVQFKGSVTATKISGSFSGYTSVGRAPYYGDYKEITLYYLPVGYVDYRLYSQKSSSATDTNSVSLNGRSDHQVEKARGKHYVEIKGGVWGSMNVTANG